MKTTNNANLNKLMNKKSNKGAVESMKQLQNNRNNEVLNKVYDGSIELKQLLNITDKCIDMTKCTNPIQVMQKIYSAGSEVGSTTVKGQNAYMTDVTTDEGFNAFKESLVMLKKQASHTPYESVWIEGYNMFKQFNFETGQHYVYYVVTNEEIKMLADRIKAMSKDKMTKEDAQTLQADMPPFIRAFQESSIDVSKDKDKVFTLNGKTVTIKAFLNTIAAYSHLTKSYKDSIDFGFKAVKQAKHAGKVIPKFEYTNDARDAEKPVMDLMGHVTVALEDTATNKLNDSILELYKVADNSLYDQFVNDAEISRELAYYIKSIYRICYAARAEETKIADEDYAAMRNAIYTAALEYGVDREDVIRVAIAAAMTKVYKDKDGNIKTKDADVNSFRTFPVANIFTDEFITVVADEVVYETINPQDVICNITRDIEENEELVFVNGVSEDGCVELYDTTFNGTLVEYEGNFVQFKDVYAFEVANALLVNENTFRKGATKEELMRVKSGDKAACDNGEFLNSLTNELTTATITGANANLLTANKAFLCQFIANYTAVKGAVTINNIITYEPNNGEQQMFLLFV